MSGNQPTNVQICIAGNKPFLEWIQTILIKRCKLNKIKIYPLEGKAYRLQYTGNQIFRILDYLYKHSSKDNRLDRKYKKYLEYSKLFRR